MPYEVQSQPFLSQLASGVAGFYTGQQQAKQQKIENEQKQQEYELQKQQAADTAAYYQQQHQEWEEGAPLRAAQLDEAVATGKLTNQQATQAMHDNGIDPFSGKAYKPLPPPPSNLTKEFPISDMNSAQKEYDRVMKLYRYYNASPNLDDKQKANGYKSSMDSLEKMWGQDVMAQSRVAAATVTGQYGVQKADVTGKYGVIKSTITHSGSSTKGTLNADEENQMQSARNIMDKAFKQGRDPRSVATELAKRTTNTKVQNAINAYGEQLEKQFLDPSYKINQIMQNIH